MGSIYKPADAAFAQLDARDLAYRYDIDADIRWDLIDAPGTIAPESYLLAIGVDVAGLRACGALDLFEWLYGLMVCEQFIELERVVIRWIKTKNEDLVRSQSIEWLRDEEIKHIKTFRRYRQHLLAQRPELAEQASALLHEHNPPTHLEPTGEDDQVGLHYLTWLEILAFEEYTVHLYTALQESPETIQPAWLDIHRCHAQEEVCHVETDVEYLRALEMSDEARLERSKQSVTWMMARYTKTFRTPVKMLLDLRPELAGQVGPGKPPKGFLDALFTSDDFRHTRDCAPYLAWLAERSRP